ncbi:RidA family protein [Aerococcus suis]|uniref:Enamine deaminase RidA, house cleaning of reactive enamine intermediates, YjgF/YER057c/UK114 family n=1 Tax=Aerococcus suis TaxID=371602 RepID=A0A1W1Y466_9LACT|nr:RidA family protein [Aerococcus suis]MCI7240090.1 RidA family protein [Aerococcus suis]MDD7758067.1 RidA family protein [Aerococcus suis]MDY4646330.1 RidA family protein [Aerococcus suis]SMC30917.1 Enamine deaminase RidA, house cleaning of reactive enamine intermediates, YjgF/YER057c/UK114 family [Aerococcus suis]
MSAFVNERKANGFLFVSGQLPKNDQGEVDKTLSIYDQTLSALSAIEKAAETEGASREDIVKTQLFITDISQIGEANKAYEDFFKNVKPIRSAFEVKGLVGGVAVEVDGVVELNK